MKAFLARRTKPVLVLDHVVGFDQGINWTTGDLSCRCFGHIVQQGRRQGTVRGSLLRGNLVHALGQVLCVASDTDRHVGVDAPGLCVDGLSIERGS